jgi:hypothetical protein
MHDKMILLFKDKNDLMDYAEAIEEWYEKCNFYKEENKEMRK